MRKKQNSVNVFLHLEAGPIRCLDRGPGSHYTTVPRMMARVYCLVCTRPRPNFPQEEL
jgi:hypothetical protein